VIQKFLQAKQLEDQSVWVNLSGSHTVNRFVRLPPVKDKESRKLLVTEVKQLIPIPLDELSMACWIRHLDDEVIIGRPGVVTAARKSIVTARMELLEACGLKLDGLQSDTVALANFGAHEFAPVWASVDAKPSSGEELLKRAVVMVDCGASATNLVIVSGESQWYWTLETGGEDLTALLSRTSKLTNEEAEKLKRNPAALSSPAKQYELIEQRLDEVRARLSTIASDGMRQNSDWKVIQTWCMGGGWQAHQWIRRVILRHHAKSHENR
jgi:Tfp pilus assembly PilM family ATPase